MLIPELGLPALIVENEELRQETQGYHGRVVLPAYRLRSAHAQRYLQASAEVKIFDFHAAQETSTAWVALSHHRTRAVWTVVQQPGIETVAVQSEMIPVAKSG